MFTRRCLTTLVAFIVLLALIGQSPSNAQSENVTDKLAFWNTQRRGANFFNELPTLERLIAARELGIEFIRLAPNKWHSDQRDFLIGNADNWTGLVESDLDRVRWFLGVADSLGMKVVFTTLSLPGARWRQQNNGKDDARIWQDTIYHARAAEFWRVFAESLQDHPALVAYNILNEPHPERATGYYNYRTQSILDWYERVKSTAADLNAFNERVVKAIRSVDHLTPIMIDAGLYANAPAFRYLRSIPDDRILYSLHMYEPFEFTNKRTNDGRFSYPGPIVYDDTGDTIFWDRQRLEDYLFPAVEWCKLHAIASNRIVVGEFGCHRVLPGAQAYLADLVQIFNRHEWHWAFYSYREDTWDGMDYECGTKGLGAEYWRRIKAADTPARPRRANPLWDVIRSQFSTRN